MRDYEKISKARSLFKERGAIRREFIRDEIAYSWGRSKLYSKKNVEFKDVNTKININGEEKPIESVIDYIYNSINIDRENYCALVVGRDGKIKNTMNKYTTSGIKNKILFREEQIGTNGLGMAFSLKKSMIVYGSEHYDEVLDDYISLSIMEMQFEILEGVFGFLVKKEHFDPGLIEEILRLDFKDFDEKKSVESERFIKNPSLKKLNVDIFKNERRSERKKSLDISQEKYSYTKIECEEKGIRKSSFPYCLMGNSKEKIELRARVMNLGLKSSFINIIGPKACGKEYLARFIHESSKRKKYGFIKINPRNDIGYVIENEIANFEKGTLYIENIGELSSSTRAKLQRKIDCKLVNNNSENGLCDRDIAFIFSNTSEDESLKVDSIPLTSLNIRLKSLKQSQSDLQYIVSEMLRERLALSDKIKNLHMYSPTYIEEKSKELLLEMLEYPVLNSRNLESIFNKLVDLGEKSIVVKRLKVDSDESKVSISEDEDNKNKKFKKLEDVELEYIHEVIEYTENNIARASEILGIGRTTIYRKLKND